MIDLVVAITALVAALVVAVIAWKTEALNRGGNLPATGWLNRLAWRWYRWILKRREAPDSAVPDRSPEEVDAIRIEARRARLRKEASANALGSDFAVTVSASLTRSVDYDPNRPPRDSGQIVNFEYVDAQGEVTDRIVRNWEIDGRYLHGHCMTRRAGRQFRLDRVTHWRSWE